MRELLLTVVGLVLLSGCSSYESTVLQQNGGLYTKGPKTDGFTNRIPIPSDAWKVTDSFFRMPDGTVAMVHDIDTSQTLQVTRWALINTDIKRPISGSAKTSVAFEDHSITALSSDVTDNTLDKILAGLAQLKEATDQQVPGNPDLEGLTADAKIQGAPSGGRFLGSRSYLYVYDSLNGVFQISPLVDDVGGRISALPLAGSNT